MKSCSKIRIPQERRRAVMVTTGLLLAMLFLLTKGSVFLEGSLRTAAYAPTTLTGPYCGGAVRHRCSQRVGVRTVLLVGRCLYVLFP